MKPRKYLIDEPLHDGKRCKYIYKKVEGVKKYWKFRVKFVGKEYLFHCEVNYDSSLLYGHFTNSSFDKVMIIRNGKKKILVRCKRTI